MLTKVLAFLSFKARGACNVLSSMSPSDKSKGITVSGGRNYLLAMTHYGFRQSVPINVIVPKDCPLTDKQRLKENFAIIKVHGNDYNDASLHALSYSDEIGANYVHGFVQHSYFNTWVGIYKSKAQIVVVGRRYFT